ncbi:MAG TPA: hypothetical protein VGN17_01515 [Bryobacteraceae bacterium]|jgi:hypothetical protein
MALLSDAPSAVDAFASGHWDLMGQLEQQASAVMQHRNVPEAAAFLADVAYLKRPHSIDRETVRRALLGCSAEILPALDALASVRDVDYAAMDELARVPWFGRGGGRSFNSAVLRLVCPQQFGIIDWRNVAVLCGSAGFEGLVAPPVVFPEFSRQDVLEVRGHLPFTSAVYRRYNDVLRSLAAAHRLRAADIDLILWTYSIQKQPFRTVTFPIVSPSIVVGPAEHASLRANHSPVAQALVNDCLAGSDPSPLPGLLLWGSSKTDGQRWTVFSDCCDSARGVMFQVAAAFAARIKAGGGLPEGMGRG